MDGAQVGVLKESDEVGLGGLLQGEEGRGLEADVNFIIIGNLADEALEGGLAVEQVGGLLVASDLAQGDGSGAVTVGLLHAAGVGSRMASLFGGQMLAGRLASDGPAGGLLGACHG